MRLSTLPAALSLPLVVACSHPSAPPAGTARAAVSASSTPERAAAAPATERRRAAHALDRLAFGPRPGDVDRVAALGVDRWIDEQLSPERIDDAEVERALDALPVTKMSIAEVRAAYPKPMEKKGKEKKEKGDRAKGKADDPAAADEKKGKPGEITEQLAEAKLLRATMSRRQLEEVLTDFWFNRFNVFSGKGQDRWDLVTYERDAIRPHVFGKFRDLLGATAAHPAMLFYLDNWQSVADGTKKKGGAEGGLNENYGRELLELHTLGVDGGYTQDDVRNVARAFTGWTIAEPQGASTFLFRPKQHDEEPKTVLGKTIALGGQRDGEAVLDLVANHPSTAHSVALALARRFVSDDPPKALVDTLASTFTSTDGDLRAVYRKLFTSDAFWAEEAYDAKVKKPLDLAVSAIRAAGATYDGSPALVRRVAKLGEPLYGCPPPTGYKDTADVWVNAGSLVNRINFGLDLGAGRIRGVHVDATALAGGGGPEDASTTIDRIAAELLDRPLSPATKSTIVAAVEGTNPHPKSDYQDPTPPSAPKIIGLLVGSPEFQKR